MEYETNYRCKNCGQEYKLNPTIVNTDVGAVKWNKGEYLRLKTEYDEAQVEIEAYSKKLEEKIREYRLKNQERLYPFFWIKRPSERFSSVDGLILFDKEFAATDETMRELGLDTSALNLKIGLIYPERKPERFTVCLYCQDRYDFPVARE